jgi:RNA polymerase sigma-70 factor (ECF subfamily)
LLGVVEFEGFYRRERDALARLCYLTTLDVDAAADAAQEAMLRAWQRWESLASGDPAAWVRTVALNLCRSRWRRIQRELRLAPRLFVRADEQHQPRDLDMVQALRGLSARQREAIVLHYLADLPVDDIAAAMGVSPGAVKRHLSRGRQALAAVPLAATIIENLL